MAFPCHWQGKHWRPGKSFLRMTQTENSLCEKFQIKCKLKFFLFYSLDFSSRKEQQKKSLWISSITENSSFQQPSFRPALTISPVCPRQMARSPRTSKLGWRSLLWWVFTAVASCPWAFAATIPNPTILHPQRLLLTASETKLVKAAIPEGLQYISGLQVGGWNIYGHVISKTYCCCGRDKFMSELSLKGNARELGKRGQGFTLAPAGH